MLFFDPSDNSEKFVKEPTIVKCNVAIGIIPEEFQPPTLDSLTIRFGNK